MSHSDNIQVAPQRRTLGIVRLLIVATVICGLVGLSSARAENTVTDWNNEFLQITQSTSGNLVAGPPEVAREIAQVGESMSDAVNAATGSTISSFAYTAGSASGADANVAVATAAYTALYNIFTDPAWQTPISTVTGSATPNTSNQTLANNVVIPELQSFLSSQLNELGLSNPSACASSTTAACNGYNLGIAAATAVNKAPATSPVASGAVASIQNGLMTQAPAGSGTLPGVYVPPTSRPEMFPTWGGVAPTGITGTQLKAAEGAISGPPAIGSQAYQQALLQTECEGSNVGLASLPEKIQTACSAAGYKQETNAQANAALFWNDPGTTAQPPGHWLQIANTVMQSQNSSLLQSAQLTALLGEAENNAGIAAWGIKYDNNLWRPVTAIRNCGTGGTTAGTVTWSTHLTTCDTSWSSLIATPPHPDYVAGHPAFSGAAATVLADFFGTDNIPFSSSSNYYCNGGSAQFDPSTNLLVSCTLNSVVYAVSNPADCAAISNGIDSNGSPLICPITETYASFSNASEGPQGAEFSRVVGGIHTPFSVEDALTLGNAVGAAVTANSGLPDVVSEPSSLSVCALSLLALIRLRRRIRLRDKFCNINPGTVLPRRQLPQVAIVGLALLLATGSANAGELDGKLKVQAEALAKSLTAACPVVAYGDEAAFQSCGRALRKMMLPIEPAIAWGGDQPTKQIKKKTLTHLNSDVFKALYLPLYCFTGRWSLENDKRSHVPIIRVEAYFRNILPFGDYPYPFWHSADKWHAYEASNEIGFYLDSKGLAFIVTRDEAGSEERRGAYTVARTPAFTGAWQWRDATGRLQPQASLFSARYSQANPYLPALDRSYKAFAMRIREESCLDCHTPANKSEAERLVLLQTPIHASGEINNVIKAVQSKEMPEDDIGLRKDIPADKRAAVLSAAVTFRDQLVLADKWQASHGR